MQVGDIVRHGTYFGAKEICAEVSSRLGDLVEDATTVSITRGPRSLLGQGRIKIVNRRLEQRQRDP